MKANINNRPSETVEEAAARIKQAMFDGSKGELLQTVTKIVTSPVNAFCVSVVKQGKKQYGIIIMINNDKNFYSYYNPVNFCGNSTRKKNCVVLKYGKRNIIISADETRRLGINEIKRLKIDGSLSPEDKRSYIKILNKSKTVTSEFGKINYSDTQIIAIKDEPETAEETAEEVTETAEETAEEVTETAEETAEEVTEETAEESILDKIIESQEKMSTPEAKRLAEKLVDLDIDISILDDIEKYDAMLVSSAKTRMVRDTAYENVIKSEEKISEIEYQINALYITRKKYILAAAEFEELYQTSSSAVDSFDTNIEAVKNEINAVIEAAEKEAEEQQALLDAEKKAEDLLNGLDELTRKILEKKLGITVTATVVPEASGVTDMSIELVDGNTIKPTDGKWTWAEIKSHAVDISHHLTTASVPMLKYIKSLNISRKDLNEAITPTYATIIIEAMVENGLYTKRTYNPTKSMTEEQKLERARRAGETRRKKNAAIKAAKENNII